MPESWLCQKVEEIDDRLQRTELILDRLGMGVGATANFHGTTFEVSEYQIAQWVAGTPLPLTDASSYARLHSGGLEIRGGKLDIQTAASGARMEMTGSAMTTYDSSDNETFKLDFTNGDVAIAGTFTTPYITIDNTGITIQLGTTQNEEGKTIKFVTGTGTLAGSITAWRSGGGTLMNMIFGPSELDINSYTVLDSWSSATYTAQSFIKAHSGSTTETIIQCYADSDGGSGLQSVAQIEAEHTNIMLNETSGYLGVYSVNTDAYVVRLLDNGGIEYKGNLTPYRNSTTYTGYVFVPLTTPLTSTSWDGDSKGTGDDGTIDLSTVFGAPAGIKAVLIRRRMEDATVGTEWTAGPSASSTADIIRAQVTNVYVESNAIIPCDANGDIYCTFSATIDACHMQIHGYWI